MAQSTDTQFEQLLIFIKLPTRGLYFGNIGAVQKRVVKACGSHQSLTNDRNNFLKYCNPTMALLIFQIIN